MWILQLSGNRKTSSRMQNMYKKMSDNDYLLICCAALCPTAPSLSSRIICWRLDTSKPRLKFTVVGPIDFCWFFSRLVEPRSLSWSELLSCSSRTVLGTSRDVLSSARCLRPYAKWPCAVKVPLNQCYFGLFWPRFSNYWPHLDDKHLLINPWWRLVADYLQQEENAEKVQANKDMKRVD